MADILYWLLALLPIFLTTSLFCVPFSNKLVPLKRLTAATSAEARIGNEQAYFGVSFWSLGFFGLGKADFGSFS